MIKKELIHMNAYLPEKLADLSKYDEVATIRILKDWGYGKKPLRALWKEVNEELEKHK